MRPRTILIACVALIAAAGACLLWQALLRQRLPATIVLCGPKNISMLPLIADKQGFFKAQGLACRFEPVQSGKIAMDSLANGDVHLGVLVETNVAFIKYRPGADIRVLCSLMEKTDDALVARRDRGISKPAELAGKRIGYFPATTSHLFLWKFLAAHGVPAASVELAAMTPPAMEAAIVKGDLDAASLWQPFRFNALRKLGDKGIEFRNEGVYTAFAVLAARKGFVEGHREECVKVLRALVEAQEFLERHPAEAIPMLAEAIGVEETALRSAWGEYKNRVRLDRELLLQIKEEGEWIRNTDKDFTDKPLPSYDDVLQPELLKSLFPDRLGLD